MHIEEKFSLFQLELKLKKEKEESMWLNKDHGLTQPSCQEVSCFSLSYQLLGYWVMGLVWRSKPIREIKSKKKPIFFQRKSRHIYGSLMGGAEGFSKNQRMDQRKTPELWMPCQKNLKKPCITSLKRFENPNPRVIPLHYNKMCSYDKNDFTKIFWVNSLILMNRT